MSDKLYLGNVERYSLHLGKGQSVYHGHACGGVRHRQQSNKHYEDQHVIPGTSRQCDYASHELSGHTSMGKDHLISRPGRVLEYLHYKYHVSVGIHPSK